jgi:hypothetical protein
VFIFFQKKSFILKEQFQEKRALISLTICLYFLFYFLECQEGKREKCNGPDRDSNPLSGAPQTEPSGHQRSNPAECYTSPSVFIFASDTDPGSYLPLAELYLHVNEHQTVTVREKIQRTNNNVTLILS